MALASLAVATAGCGEATPEPSEPGRLAERVPSNAKLYFEGVLRPGGELDAKLTELISTFGGDEDDRSAFASELLESFEGDLSAAGELDYEDDIRPWLGSRGAAYVQVPDLEQLRQDRIQTGELDGGSTESAALLEVSDTDEAERLLERLYGDSSDPGDARYVKEDDPAVRLEDGLLVIGSPEAVAATPRSASTSASSVAEQEWFQQGLERVGGDDSLGFAVFEAATAVQLGAIDDAPRFSERYGDRLLEDGVTIDLDGAVTLDVNLADTGLAVDQGSGVREPVDLESLSESLGKLPGDAWLAATDPLITPTLIRSLGLGVEIGIEQEGLTRAGLLRRLGYDPRDSLGRLGTEAAFFARGDGLGDLTAGALIEARRPDPTSGAYAVDAARLLIAGLPGSSISQEPLDYGGPFGFSAEVAAIPRPLTAVQSGTRLGIIVGPRDTSEIEAAFEPAEPLSETSRLEDAQDALGPDWTPTGLLELDPVLELLAEVAPAELEGLESSDLLPGANLYLGASAGAGERTVQQRYLFAP